jgi:hypothetical protein
MRASPKKKFEAMSAVMPRPERTDAARGPDLAKGRLVRKIARKLARPLDLAFKNAKLDSGNKEHWPLLTIQLAWAVYGTRGPGAPKSWTKKRLRRLLADVRNIKIDDPRLSELECCKLLVKEGKYKETATTLRRVLQTAKKRDKESRLLAAAREPAVVSEVATVLKKPTSA